MEDFAMEMAAGANVTLVTEGNFSAGRNQSVI